MLPITDWFSWCNYCLRYLSVWGEFVSKDLWSAVVCFQPPNLLSRKVWTHVRRLVCPIHCKVRWRGQKDRIVQIDFNAVIYGVNHKGIPYQISYWGRWRFVLSIRTVSIEPITAPLWWMVLGVNWLTWYHVLWVPKVSVFLPLLFLQYTWRIFRYWRMSVLVISKTRSDDYCGIPMQALELQLHTPWTVTSARLVSGMTFRGWNWMRITANVLLLLLLLLLKKIGNARPGEGDCHPISPKLPAPHYQPIEEKKWKGK